MVTNVMPVIVIRQNDASIGFTGLLKICIDTAGNAVLRINRWDMSRE